MNGYRRRCRSKILCDRAPIPPRCTLRSRIAKSSTAAEAAIAQAPYVTFSGVDDHLRRFLMSPESGTGRGVQLRRRPVVSVTDRFSLGLGGRFWTTWTNNNAVTNFGGAACPCPTEPAKTELYGGFVQGSYTFDPAVLF
jgi:hypothetical protein